MPAPTTRPIDNPEFVQGQLDVLRVLILGLARRLPDSQAFFAEALEQIEAARTTVMGSPASDAWLAGIESEEGWVRHTLG